jgi:hypothetical protein
MVLRIFSKFFPPRLSTPSIGSDSSRTMHRCGRVMQCSGYHARSRFSIADYTIGCYGDAHNRAMAFQPLNIRYISVPSLVFRPPHAIRWLSRLSVSALANCRRDHLCEPPVDHIIREIFHGALQYLLHNSSPGAG